MTTPAPRRATYLSPGGDLSAAVDLARRAEALGYESVWVTHGLGRDSFLVLAAYAAATSRIGLGNGVVPVLPRHPVAMAQAALTLAETSGGRFRLGIGISHKPSMEGMLGLTLREPLAVMREYVAVLRGALGDGVDFDGTHYRAHWSLALPTRPAAPPVLLAALSPKMLELAGEIADGAILWLCPPAYVRDVAIPAIARGRARKPALAERRGGAATRSAGGMGGPSRPPMFEIVSAVPLAITDDPAGAREAFRAELTRYLQLPFYRAMLAAAGLTRELEAFDRSGRASDATLDALGAVGDVAAGRRYVEAYRAAGVTLPAVRPITFPDAPWYRRTLEAAADW